VEGQPHPSSLKLTLLRAVHIMAGLREAPDPPCSSDPTSRSQPTPGPRRRPGGVCRSRRAGPPACGAVPLVFAILALLLLVTVLARRGGRHSVRVRPRPGPRERRPSGAGSRHRRPFLGSGACPGPAHGTQAADSSLVMKELEEPAEPVSSWRRPRLRAHPPVRGLAFPITTYQGLDDIRWPTRATS
jgi:hypothetical protein